MLIAVLAETDALQMWCEWARGIWQFESRIARYLQEA